MDRPSASEAFSYEAVDTKLAHQPAPEHVLQLCVYADLQAHYQGIRPSAMHVVLGDRREVSFRTVDFWYYYLTLKQRFIAYTASPPAQSTPEPCALCAQCPWQTRCETEWERHDHEEDCRSTFLLRAWLLTLRPEGLPWREAAADLASAEQP